MMVDFQQRKNRGGS